MRNVFARRIVHTTSRANDAKAGDQHPLYSESAPVNVSLAFPVFSIDGEGRRRLVSRPQAEAEPSRRRRALILRNCREDVIPAALIVSWCAFGHVAFAVLVKVDKNKEGLLKLPRPFLKSLVRLSPSAIFSRRETSSRPPRGGAGEDGMEPREGIVPVRSHEDLRRKAIAG